MPTPMTAGEIIRELKVYYPETYDLNVAVNEHRRANGFKNWYAAALDLLEGWREHGGDEAQYNAFLNSLPR